jgi:stress response protein YsnF
MNQSGHINTSSNEEDFSTEQVIPVLEEDYSISKKEIIESLKMEKRWITMTKTVKIPITYINEKKMRSVESTRFGVLLSKLKDKIDMGGDNDSMAIKQSILKKNKIKEDLVPLFSQNDTRETQSVLTLFGEKIEVNKKMVKLGEVVIRKRKVAENKKLHIDTRKEKVTIRYSDGSTKALN